MKIDIRCQEPAEFIWAFYKVKGIALKAVFPELQVNEHMTWKIPMSLNIPRLHSWGAEEQQPAVGLDTMPSLALSFRMSCRRPVPTY